MKHDDEKLGGSGQGIVWLEKWSRHLTYRWDKLDYLGLLMKYQGGWIEDESKKLCFCEII